MAATGFTAPIVYLHRRGVFGIPRLLGDLPKDFPDERKLWKPRRGLPKLARPKPGNRFQQAQKRQLTEARDGDAVDAEPDPGNGDCLCSVPFGGRHPRRRHPGVD
jgi:hypothetical protein